MREGVEEYQEEFGSVSLGELIICLGFFLVYLVEELTNMAFRKKKKTIHRCVLCTAQLSYF